MPEVVDSGTWDEIQSMSPSQYLIMKQDMDPVKVTFLTGHNVCEPGDEDLAGRVWDKDWTKNEVKCERDNGEKVILSLGGPKSPLLRTFIGKWKEEGLTPNTLVGTKWYVDQVGQYDYDIRFLGRVDEGSSSSSSSSTSNKPNNYDKVLKTINELSDAPGVANGVDEEALITGIAIKSSVSKEDIKKCINILTDDGKIDVKEGKYYIQNENK
jgi:hypothetical protein